MTPKRKKVLLVVLAAALLFGSSAIQHSLNRDREALDLTRTAALENAPPVLAFTTIALGGFRGLIANVLWIRASDMQDQEKFFEMTQLADWITKLEPNFSQVWRHWAWNLAYNISVKFPNPSDRWRWVKHGIELLRDEALKYNPTDVPIFHDLGWLFQHKLGANLDDANMFYKAAWIDEMTPIFGEGRPKFDELINPQGSNQLARAKLLTETYKMDPRLVKEVDDHYGPLEWRLPEAHAIYWSYCGLKTADQNPSKINPDDLIQLHRVIFQSMQLTFRRGHLIRDPYITNSLDFDQNLDIVSKASQAYEEAAEEDKRDADRILQAHRNFLRDAAYYLYGHGLLTNAVYWYTYLGTKYPDRPILDGQPDSFPRNITLQDYAVARAQADIDDPANRDAIRARLGDFLVRAYRALIVNQADRATTYMEIAEGIRKRYEIRTAGSTNRIPMPPMSELKRDAAQQLIGYYPEEFRPAIRAKLGLEPEPPPAPAPANAPAERPSNR